MQSKILMYEQSIIVEMKYDCNCMKYASNWMILLSSRMFTTILFFRFDDFSSK